ncbi:hypothetical protein TWF102_004483 [Orbilia oligospora]|uniref:VOC domain-containing protein n=1 Tax=Orbilia oligospora TaxID=2813651 RepID=A0A7C8MYL3_ORBOL|nr:hypothetical protein TWF102_004483 [Orbilia oligospora]KAF3078820.1 hypothetical protein TWF103_005166 [Orbilia oligospora]
MHLYIEIQATIPSRAIAFYTTIFPSWSFQKDDSLPIEYYRGTFSSSSSSSSSSPATAINILKRPVPQTPDPMQGTNAFVCSFPVEDETAFDIFQGKVLELGGQIAMEKFPVPGRGWHGYFLDTEGNTFGVFTTTYRE